MGMLGASIRDVGPDVRAMDVAVVDGSGAQLTGFDPSRPATAAITSVARSATSVSLLAANAARRRVSIHNTANKLHIAFGATATTAAFTILLAAGDTWEGPLNDYTGVLSGIWASAGSGSAVITEITT